jgi:uncharacterized protein YaaW (UPF0174 family)
MSTQPEIGGLGRQMMMWTDEELAAFFCCVRPDGSGLLPTDREELISRSVEELFWAYNSKAKAQASYAAAKAAQIAYDHMPDAMKRRLPAPPAVRALHEYGASLSCEMLLRECCRKLKIEKSEAEDHILLQVYLYEKVMILAVAAMTAEQRHMFLTRKVPLDDLSVDFSQTGLKGAATTLAALGAAQASGFGVYLGATTALGFVSHAVGVTLPFAVYIGMSSTIAFLIGPVGFLAAGAWLGWNLTSPEWTRITRGLLHIIAMRAKYEYKSTPLALGTSSAVG